MDTKKNTLSDILSSIFKKNKKHFLIFLIFLILSSVFWFLNALSKDYNTLISLPVKYENLPVEIALDKPLPNNLQVEISGKGFDLLKYEFTGFIFPYIIDFKEFNKKNGRYFLSTKNIIKDIQQHIPNNIKILVIYPVEINASFSKLKTKKIAIQPVLSYRLAKQYTLKGNVKIRPETITISGPSNIIDTIRFIKTKGYNLGILDHPVTEELSLKEIPNVSFSTQTIKASLDIEKFTETKIEVPIVLKNLPDSLSAKLKPSKVTITYQTTLSDFKKIHPNQFQPIIDFSNVLNNKMAPVFLQKKPRYVFNVKVLPKHILLITIPKEKK